MESSHSGLVLKCEQEHFKIGARRCEMGSRKFLTKNYL